MAQDKDDAHDSGDDKASDLPESPEKVYEDRYPQPVHVSDIVGKPLIQLDNSPVGVIKHVVRATDGKLRLIVPYGGFLGFGSRLVAVPLEAVGSIGTGLVSLDMPEEAYASAPRWTPGSETILALDEPMRVAICRH